MRGREKCTLSPGARTYSRRPKETQLWPHGAWLFVIVTWGRVHEIPLHLCWVTMSVVVFDTGRHGNHCI